MFEFKKENQYICSILSFLITNLVEEIQEMEQIKHNWITFKLKLFIQNPVRNFAVSIQRVLDMYM